MNALRSFVALALLLCAAAPLASAAESAGESSPHSVYISITNDGKSDLGVFFAGNETERRYPPAPPDGEIIVIQNSDFEALTEVLGPGENTRHGTHFDHAFIIRTADMQFRAKITVFKGDDRPYVLSFKNIMSEHPNGEDDPHMELKHSNTGFVWINPEKEESHGTDADHDFQLRDKGSNAICTIRLKHVHDEL